MTGHAPSAQLPPNADSPQWQIDRATFAAALDALLDMPTLADLRIGVAKLRRRLADPDDRLRQSGDDAIHFTPEVLQAELDQIAAARTLERARYYLSRLRRSLTAQRFAPASDIDLYRWKEYDDILTDSLWLIERRDNSGVHRADYWGNFVPQIPRQFIRRYTRPGEWVIDPFAGSGTTLIEARRLGRHAIGIELQAQMVDHVHQLLAAEPPTHPTIAAIEQGDSLETDFQALLARYGATSAQLVLLHPPYHDIIRFSSDPRDLSNAPTITDFLNRLKLLTERLAAALDRGRYLALVIGDTYRRGEWYPLGFQAMETIRACGFSLKSIIVKNFTDTLGKRGSAELWRYRALAGGFYVFKHEYIFLLRRR
ncbi:TRM11 family SAM-dependent methyltransferase [Chloroflexus sp.]|uniref:TRM11 family SAM-dependent methyltransferase n=1 Tax=Chloroflexus sp. TaxID=1904827 RepID=UPI0026026D25|nr:DNA methyltransferase [uncultured Chloroflexus sp.]